MLCKSQDNSQHRFSIETLTERELEILKLVAEGLTNKEMARKLDISNNTVKTHIKIYMETPGKQKNSGSRKSKRT